MTALFALSTGSSMRRKRRKNVTLRMRATSLPNRVALAAVRSSGLMETDRSTVRKLVPIRPIWIGSMKGPERKRGIIPSDRDHVPKLSSTIQNSDYYREAY